MAEDLTIALAISGRARSRVISTATSGEEGGTICYVKSARSLSAPSRTPWGKAEERARLSRLHTCTSLEFDEEIKIAADLLAGFDPQELKTELWVPLARDGNAAIVLAAAPDSALREKAARALGVENVEFRVALPEDVVRIIEHHQDLNPGFPPAGGRTPLAQVRTFLAHRRLRLNCDRTSFAKARTGLAFLRTGISFITIALVLLRIFGLGWMLLLETPLLIGGIVMGVDGLLWYVPARRQDGRRLDCRGTEGTWGTTVLAATSAEPEPIVTRTAPIEGAAKLRADWNNLSPVMRRRFLASDRTDMAEERTTLACLRTVMARARTGLAFTRTGIALIGLGIALLRQFRSGPWTALDFSLIGAGVVVSLEGFHWYFSGRRAGIEGDRSVRATAGMTSIWDLFFPPVRAAPIAEAKSAPAYLRRPCRPGIWGTTGLALERTLLADRRNLMARLRTVMARSRTGLAFIRTGMSVSSVGLGLLVYFGVASPGWTIFNVALVLFGCALIGDGLFWHLPAEKLRKGLPYCFGDLEIALPDYGRPAATWKNVVFSHDNA